MADSAAGTLATLDLELAPVVRVVRTVLVVDLVESVRLIEHDEEGTVGRWRSLVVQVERDLLPRHRGHLIKGLGDGMMLEFERVSDGVEAAFAVQALVEHSNAGQSAEQAFHVRIGAHVARLIADDGDIYGHGVNLASRLTTLAGPGEIVVSAELRDLLTPSLDAELEDLGDCFLKHVQRPVHAYRIGPPGDQPVVEPASGMQIELRPTVAIIPFARSTDDTEHALLGHVLADELIYALSRGADVQVISRLSTAAFSERAVSLPDLARHLNANYVLSGHFHVKGRRATLMAEFADTGKGAVLWTRTLQADVDALVAGQATALATLADEMARTMVHQELSRAAMQPLPTLESYTLLLAAVSLMHRLVPRDFERARHLLEALTERAPRLAVPYAWLAKWHVLRVQQGWAADPAAEAAQALDCTRRALDNDPQCALALAVDGFVHTNLLRRFDIALERYEHALTANPNESLAWLLKGTLHAFRGEGRVAVRDTRHALRLSPLDPLRYFFDSLAATAALAAGQYARARTLAARSLKLNRSHASTLRALAIAQWQLGLADEARSTVGELLRIDPGFTVDGFVRRSPSSGFETGRVWATALRAAGVPE